MRTPMPKTLILACALLSLALPSPAQTHSHDHHSATPTATPTATPAATATSPVKSLPMVNAEVRRVDAGAGTLTLKHGAIPNLDMPPMTMVFQVRDPSLLGPLKVGDKLRFSADKLNGAYTVVDLEATP